MKSRIPLLPLGLTLGLLAAPVLAVGAAPPVANATKNGDEIRVPAEYARVKLSRYPEKAPPAEYHVTVDVTPGKRGQATIARSSGFKSVDAVALDFADAYSTQIPRLRELRQTREMRFPLLFDLRKVEGVWHTHVPKGAVSTTTTLSAGGLVMIRVATGPDGHVNQAKVVKSSGLERFDEALEKYALQHWSGPPNSATIISSLAIRGDR